MSDLSGYACDTCGKQGSDTNFGGLRPSWYMVFPGFDNWKKFHFCSKTCLEGWVTGKAPVEVPESKGVLFRKWLKAVFA